MARQSTDMFLSTRRRPTCSWKIACVLPRIKRPCCNPVCVVIPRNSSLKVSPSLPFQTSRGQIIIFRRQRSRHDRRHWAVKGPNRDQGHPSHSPSPVRRCSEILSAIPYATNSSTDVCRHDATDILEVVVHDCAADASDSGEYQISAKFKRYLAWVLQLLLLIDSGST